MSFMFAEGQSGPFKLGSSHQSHFISEINVGKSRIQHITILNLNDVIINRP